MSSKQKTAERILLRKHSEEKNPSTIDYAISLFIDYFGYQLQGNQTAPPDAAVPVNPRVAESATLPEDLTQQALEAFLKGVIESQNLPDWVHDEAEKDLIAWAESGTSSRVGAPNASWSFKFFQKDYDPPDVATSNAINTNAILMLMSTSVKAPDGTSTTKTEVCYVGVYYDIKPSLERLKSRLRQGAYQEADKVTQHPGSPITDDVSLAEALGPFESSLFQNHFNYKWGDNPPDFTDNGSYKKNSTEALYYSEDGDTDGIKDFITQKVLEGDLPTAWPGIQDQVVGDISSALTGVLSQDPNRRTWDAINYDKRYHDPQGNLDSLRINGVIGFYTISFKLFDGDVARIAYLFWIGEVYSKPPILTQVYNDLVAKLYDNLSESGIASPPQGLSGNRDGLIQLLSLCALPKFQTTWGYDYNGPKTTPSDSNGDEVYAVSVFGEFPGDLTEDELKRWSADNVFVDGAFSSFKTAPQLKSNLDNQIVRWMTQSSTTTQNNEWGVTQYFQSITDPTNDQKLIKVDGNALYANGDLKESGFEVKSNFLQFIGVFYIADSPSDSGSDSGV